MTAKPDRDEERVGGMTMSERVEAAARELARFDIQHDIWGELGWEQDTYRRNVRTILAAAIPEVFGDHPTVWLAPWEASEAMKATGWDMRYGESDPEQAVIEWRVLRDARLNPNRSEGDG
jgi:hypothetical protein